MRWEGKWQGKWQGKQSECKIGAGLKGDGGQVEGRKEQETSISRYAGNMNRAERRAGCMSAEA